MSRSMDAEFFGALHPRDHFGDTAYRQWRTTMRNLHKFCELTGAPNGVDVFDWAKDQTDTYWTERLLAGKAQ